MRLTTIKLWGGSICCGIVGSIIGSALWISNLPPSYAVNIDQGATFRVSAQNGLIAGALTASVLSLLGFGKARREDLMGTQTTTQLINQRLADQSLPHAEFIKLSEMALQFEVMEAERKQSSQQALTSQPTT